jgi:hypothetical protein
VKKENPGSSSEGIPEKFVPANSWRGNADRAKNPSSSRSTRRFTPRWIASSTFTTVVPMTHKPLFSKCPNCDAPFPVFVHVETDVDKMAEITEITMQCTCYQCGANVDLNMKLGSLSEVRKNAS